MKIYVYVNNITKNHFSHEININIWATLFFIKWKCDDGATVVCSRQCCLGSYRFTWLRWGKEEKGETGRSLSRYTQLYTTILHFILCINVCIYVYANELLYFLGGKFVSIIIFSCGFQQRLYMKHIVYGWFLQVILTLWVGNIVLLIPSNLVFVSNSSKRVNTLEH